MSTRAPLTVVFFVLLTISVQGQSTASIEGLITDQQGALIRGAEITAIDSVEAETITEEIRVPLR